MANEYLYGAYGHIGETVAQNATQAGTVPVYPGTAPVNLVRGFADADLINYPVKLTNFVEAQRIMGFSSNWEAFTLCEVITAHLNNTKGNIGPIFVINVLDPSVHQKAEDTTVELLFTNGRNEFRSDTIILDTFLLANKMESVDFTLDYNFTRGTVVISSLDPNVPLSGKIAATFREVDPAMVVYEDIIGGETATGEYMGLGALKLLYMKQYQVANLIVAPGWSHIPAVYNAMVTAGMKINGHWEAFVLADIPLVNAEGDAVDTRQKAYTWAEDNGYTNERSKAFWPMVTDNLGRVFHLSTLAAVEFMRVDFSHGSVPMETCGNEPIPVIRQYFGEDNTNRGFDQQQGNELTQRGISTAVPWGGQWVLWGSHTAAYKYGADVDPRAIFDVNMRMLMYIVNSFQREWGTTIDEPMDVQLRDRILNREQEKLDALVTMGALIGEPRIVFLESENSTTDLMNGDFRWDISATPTPPLKSATVFVSYTDAGFSVYFEEEGGA